MPQEKDTIYPLLRYSLSQKEVESIFALEPEEIVFSEKYTDNEIYSLFVVILYKSYQRYKRFISLSELPNYVITFVCLQMNYNVAIDLKIILKYDHSRQRSRHIRLLRAEYGMKALSKNILMDLSLEFAKTKEHLVEIINCTIESLIYKNYDLPAFDTLKGCSLCMM